MRDRPFFALFGAVMVLAVVTLLAIRPPEEPRVAATDLGAFGFEPGELVPDFRYRSVNAGPGSLTSLLDGKRALVIALRTVECPVSQRYGHRLAELERAYAERGVTFAFLDVSPQDGDEQYREDLEVYGFEGPYIGDPEARIGNVLQARVSTEVFVIDASLTLRYRGAVDDQFGINFSKPVVRERWLEDALEQVLAGEDVEVASTEASGCYLEIPEQPVPARAITYHNRVSRIVQEKCVGCHRDGGVAPMALDSYEQLSGFSEMIDFVVREGTMPPWFATQEHGVFKNDIRLSERDERDLLAWIAAGKPLGDPQSAPAPRSFATRWMLEREPDAVVRLQEPQQVPERGVLDYRYLIVPTDFDTDVWVRSAEIRPTAIEQTHHVIAYLENDDGSRGSFFFGYAPGTYPADYPDDAAKLLRKGQRLIFETHYTPNGRSAVDQTEMALIFADGPPAHEIRTSAVTTRDFAIPPHTADYQVVAERSFRRGATVLSLLPHMHLRGKAFRIEHVRADGSAEVVLDVPRYDFNWQLSYEFAHPLRVEAGESLRGTAWYDNSTANPWNPDPDATVRYGEQTFEEMMFGFYDYISDPAPAASAPGSGD